MRGPIIHIDLPYLTREDPVDLFPFDEHEHVSRGVSTSCFDVPVCLLACLPACLPVVVVDFCQRAF